MLFVQVKKYILFSGIIFTTPIYFIFPKDIAIYNDILISSEGLYIFTLLSLRLVIFYIVFEIITNVVSPVKLFNDFTRAGFDDIALLSSVTLNQLNNISIIILEVFSNYNMRFSGKQKLFKINLLIMSILRISLKKADDLAFSLYCTETCVERKIEKSLFFSKHDLELLIIPSIMVLIKVI